MGLEQGEEREVEDNEKTIGLELIDLDYYLKTLSDFLRSKHTVQGVRVKNIIFLNLYKIQNSLNTKYFASLLTLYNFSRILFQLNIIQQKHSFRLHLTNMINTDVFVKI